VAAPEDELRSHLDSGEELLWAGRPAQGIVLTPLDWFYIPFCAVWLGAFVSTFWPKPTKTQDPLALFVAAGIFGGGIFVLVGRYVADLWYRSRLIYGSARHHLIGHTSSLRAINISILPQYFEARRAPGSQRHDLLQSAIFILLPRQHLGGVGTQFFRIACE
jgi:hypothetical protein